MIQQGNVLQSSYENLITVWKQKHTQQPWLCAHTPINPHLGAWLTRGSAWYRGKLYVLNSSLVVIPGQVSSVGVPVGGEIKRINILVKSAHTHTHTKAWVLHKQMLIQTLLWFSHQGCEIWDEARPPQSIQGREVCQWSFHKRCNPHPCEKTQEQRISKNKLMENKARVTPKGVKINLFYTLWCETLHLYYE